MESLSMIAQSAKQNIAEETDYQGADGLMYCANCHTPKQVKLNFLGKEMIVYSLCKCKTAERDQKKLDEAKGEELQRVRELRISSLLDEKFKQSRFSSFEKTKYNEKQFHVGKKYSDNFGRMLQQNQGLLMYGNCGTGKSYLAACIANELLDTGTSVVMTSFVKLLNQMQGMNKDAEDQLKAMLCRPKLLIIDDLGAERSTDYALEKVYGIIDGRYREGKPIILTTNLDLKEMQQTGDIRYARIYDRIFEICYPVEFNGPSFRVREASRRFEEIGKFLEE